MRMIVVNQQGTTAQALGTRLLGDAAGKEATLERIRLLNPHVDLEQIAPGTVLFVPDAPGLKEGESASIGGQAFDAFHDQVKASLEAAAAQVQKGHEALATERAEVQTALKGAAVKRLLESNPDLRPQLDDALKVYKRDQQDAKDSQARMKALQEGALAELDALAKLLG